MPGDGKETVGCPGDSVPAPGWEEGLWKHALSSSFSLNWPRAGWLNRELSAVQRGSTWGDARSPSVSEDGGQKRQHDLRMFPPGQV